MSYEVIIARASDLWTIEIMPEGRAGVWFLNWALRPIESGNQPKKWQLFSGLGLYAIAYRDQLIYIGSYLGVGKSSSGLGSNVVDGRWWAHLGALTSRGYGVRISEKTLMALENELGFEHFLVRGFRLARNPEKLPVGDGNPSALRNILFAARNLQQIFDEDVDPNVVLDRFTFIYVRATGAMLDVEPRKLARRLKDAEFNLVSRWCPPCNSGKLVDEMDPINVAFDELGPAMIAELGSNLGEVDKSIHDFLSGQQAETMPEWLKNYRPGDRFDRKAFFGGRVVYYPGAGTDGHPVELFAAAGISHTFIYVDYGIDESQILNDLIHRERGFSGYHVYGLTRVEHAEMTPNGWRPHIGISLPRHHPMTFALVTPFALLTILERDENRDESHGPKRLAILFLGGDGIASYDALYCQVDSPAPPLVLVVVDHGFGGNYDRFGNDGLLHRIANECDAVPAWLLVAENSAPWEGFNRVRGVAPSPARHRRSARYLFHREGEKVMPVHFCRERLSSSVQSEG